MSNCAKCCDAQQYAATLHADVDAWCTGQISAELFAARKRTTWDAIRAECPEVELQVLSILHDACALCAATKLCFAPCALIHMFPDDRE